jgi:hypothetical protein
VRGLDRLGRLRRGSRLEAPHHLGRTRRIARLERAVALQTLAADHQRVLAAELAPHLGQRLLERRLAGCGAEIGERRRRVLGQSGRIHRGDAGGGRGVHGVLRGGAPGARERVDRVSLTAAE